MITGKGRALTQMDSESEKYAPIMHFDCRGFEPFEFAFGSGWQAESVNFLTHLDLLFYTESCRKSRYSYFLYLAVHFFLFV